MSRRRSPTPRSAPGSTRRCRRARSGPSPTSSSTSATCNGGRGRIVETRSPERINRSELSESPPPGGAPGVVPGEHRRARGGARRRRSGRTGVDLHPRSAPRGSGSAGRPRGGGAPLGRRGARPARRTPIDDARSRPTGSTSGSRCPRSLAARHSPGPVRPCTSTARDVARRVARHPHGRGTRGGAGAREGRRRGAWHRVRPRSLPVGSDRRDGVGGVRRRCHSSNDCAAGMSPDTSRLLVVRWRWRARVQVEGPTTPSAGVIPSRGLERGDRRRGARTVRAVDRPL